MTDYHPDDQPEPTEKPIRARVPEHVSGGAFSTGVIVMTAHSEFILDFVQNLGRPHQVVARVVMPHNVLPQLADALKRNIELYRSRWGDLPTTGAPAPAQVPWSGQSVDAAPPQVGPDQMNPPISTDQIGATTGPVGGGEPQQTPSGGGGGTPVHEQTDHQGTTPPDESFGQPDPPPAGSSVRQASAQDIYDDLKIKDELLSGAYANAVMIGHGPHEFSFDFITNFYPNSAVSARVFLAAGQVPRLYDSLKGTWDQMRNRMNPPPDGPTA